MGVRPHVLPDAPAFVQFSLTGSRVGRRFLTIPAKRDREASHDVQEQDLRPAATSRPAARPAAGAAGAGGRAPGPRGTGLPGMLQPLATHAAELLTKHGGPVGRFAELAVSAACVFVARVLLPEGNSRQGQVLRRRRWGRVLVGGHTPQPRGARGARALLSLRPGGTASCTRWSGSWHTMWRAARGFVNCASLNRAATRKRGARRPGALAGAGAPGRAAGERAALLR